MEIMTIANDNVQISSRDIASLTNKEHKNVKRDIETALAKDVLNFERIYKDAMNREQVEYILPKNIALGIVSGYSFDLRMKIINRLEELEHKTNKPLSFEELAKQTILLADQRIRELELKIENDKPLVAFGSAIAQSSATVKIGDWIKAIHNSGDINIGRNKAFKWMREHKYLTKDNMPMQQYINNGLFEVKEGLVVTDNKQIATFTTLLTGKGQMYFARKLKEVENN